MPLHAHGFYKGGYRLSTGRVLVYRILEDLSVRTVTMDIQVSYPHLQLHISQLSHA